MVSGNLVDPPLPFSDGRSDEGQPCPIREVGGEGISYHELRREVEVHVGPIGTDPIGTYHLPDPDGTGFNGARGGSQCGRRCPRTPPLFECMRRGKEELVLYPQPYPPIGEELCREQLVRGNLSLDRPRVGPLAPKLVGHSRDGYLYPTQSLATVVFHDIQIEAL